MIAQFALRLVCGISLIWLLLPRDRITSGFFRIQMRLALGVCVLAALTIGDLAGPSAAGGPLLAARWVRLICLVAAAASYAGSVVWTLDRRRAGTICAWAVAVSSTAALLLSSVPRTQLASPIGLLTAASEMAAALLIGAATAGMLLGHWYLTAPTMSISPLARLNGWFGSAAVLRMLVSLGGLALVWPSLAGGTPVLWLAMRWIAGIAGPMVLALMVWRILKYRNTQAATGVLFVGVIVSFIGELSATLASRALQVPL